MTPKSHPMQQLPWDPNATPEEILQHIESHKLLRPADYLQHAQTVLRKSSASSLSATRRLTILEQMVISALHMNQTSIAESSLTDIVKVVGATSTRYRKLLALCLESRGEYDEALAIYQDLLNMNPSNISVVKRMYCIHKAKGERVQARLCMNDYLERNGADAAAWLVLAQDCMELGDFKGAAFAYEEVLLVSPVDPILHCTLGELYLTIATKETLILARKHFSLSLELASSDSDNPHPRSIRALMGLIRAAEQFASWRKLNGKKKGKQGTTVGEEIEDQEQEDLFQALHEYALEKLQVLLAVEHDCGPFYGKLWRQILNTRGEYS